MDPQIKRQRLETGLKLAGAGAVCIVLGPAAFLALKGLGLLIAFGLAAGTAAAGLKVVPLVSFKISNAVVKGVIAEAKANPIETLINLQVEKQRQLEAQDQNIITFATAVGNFDDKVRTYSKRYPDKAQRYKEIAGKMHEALEEQQQLQEQARHSLVELAGRITEARDMYDMALAAKQVTELSGNAQQRVFADIKQQIAFDAVTGSVNQSFAALDVAVARSKELPAIQDAEVVS
jgi:hypothetical protein